MQGGVIELAWQAAAAARAERGLRGPPRPPRMYRGDMYVAEITHGEGAEITWLGSYATPDPEPPAPAPGAGGGRGALAAYAGVQLLVGHARVHAPTNVQQPPPVAGVGGGALAAHAGVLPLVGHARVRAPPFGQQPASEGGGGALAAHARVFPLLGHARMRAPLSGQQLAPPQGPAAPVGGGAQRQAFCVQLAPPAPHLGATPVPYHGGAAESESDSDDEAVVEDNFTTGDGGASTSCAARPAVPPLRFKDLMEAEVVRRSTDEGAP